MKIYFLTNNTTNRQYVYSFGEHTHKNPPPRKISTAEETTIANAFLQNPTLTAKQISMGIGVDKIPGIENRAAINISRIQNIKRKALKDIKVIGSPLHTLKVIESQYLQELGKSLKNNPNVGEQGICCWVRHLVENSTNSLALCMLPILSNITRQSEFLVMDLKHKSKPGPFTHHFGISTFLEESTGGCCVQLCRVLMVHEKYEEAIFLFLDTLEEDGCDLRAMFIGESRTIRGILVDFSLNQLNGMKLAFSRKFGDEGNAAVDVLVSGCFVHFQRSVTRMVKVIPISNEDKTSVKNLASKIQNMKDKAGIVTIIQAIGAYCNGVKDWCEWWTQDHVLNLLLAKSSTENNLPRNTNVQEVLNHSNVPTEHGNVAVECKMMLQMDLLGVTRYFSLKNNIQLTYRDTTKKARKNRASKKRKLHDSRAPDNTATGLKQTSSSIEAVESFLKDINNNARNVLVEYAGAGVDDADDNDFVDDADDNDVGDICNETDASDASDESDESDESQSPKKSEPKRSKHSKVIRDESDESSGEEVRGRRNRNQAQTPTVKKLSVSRQIEQAKQAGITAALRTGKRGHSSTF